MKLSTLFTASIVALTGFDIAIAKSFCAKKLRRPWAWRWEIHIDEVDNIADRCDRLSKAVREQKYCEIFIPEGCGKNPYINNPNALHIWFKMRQICNDTKVTTRSRSQLRTSSGLSLVS